MENEEFVVYFVLTQYKSSHIQVMFKLNRLLKAYFLLLSEEVYGNVMN